MLSAAITLIRFWVISGMPIAPSIRLGSFGKCCDMISGSIYLASGETFIDESCGIDAPNDSDSGLINLLDIIYRNFRQGVTTTKIIESAEYNEDLRASIEDISGKKLTNIGRKYLNAIMRSKRDKIICGYKLIAEQNRNKATIWTVIKTENDDNVCDIEIDNNDIDKSENVINMTYKDGKFDY